MRGARPWLLIVLAAAACGGGSSTSDGGPTVDRPDAQWGAFDVPGWDGAGEIKGRLCSPTVESCPSKVCLHQRCVPRYRRTMVFASGNVLGIDWFQVGKDGSMYMGGVLAQSLGAAIELGPGGQGQRHAIGPAFVLRLAPDGQPIWIKNLATRFWSSAAVTPDGGVVYAGSGWVPGDTTPMATHRGYIWKIAAGGATEWVRAFEPGPLYSAVDPGAVAVDDAGDIHVAGYFTGQVDLDPGPGMDARQASPGDVFLMRLSPAGERRWVAVMGGLAARQPMGSRTSHPAAVLAPVAGGDVVLAGRGLLASAAATGEIWSGSDVFLARFAPRDPTTGPAWVRHVRSGGLIQEGGRTSDGHVALYSSWREGLYVAKFDLATGANVWSVLTWADTVDAGPDSIVLLGQKPAPPDLTGRPPVARETGVRMADVAVYDNEARFRFAIARPEQVLYSRAAVGPDGVVYLLGQMAAEPMPQSFAVDQPSETFTPVKQERHYFVSLYEP